MELPNLFELLLLVGMAALIAASAVGTRAAHRLSVRVLKLENRLRMADKCTASPTGEHVYQAQYCVYCGKLNPDKRGGLPK